MLHYRSISEIKLILYDFSVEPSGGVEILHSSSLSSTISVLSVYAWMRCKAFHSRKKKILHNTSVSNIILLWHFTPAL